MQRKQTSIKLSDGNSYIFSERNMEDRDYSRYQTLVRKAKWKELDELEKNETTLDFLKMQLINTTFTDQQVMLYIAGSQEEQKRICYDSFKIENSETSFEEFCKLIEGENLNRIIKMINTLEYEEPANDEEIKKEFGLNKEKFQKLVEGYPAVYSQMQRSVKKKATGSA